MKHIFKNKIPTCFIAAVIALFAAVFACFTLNKSETMEARAATPVTPTIYWGVQNGNTLVFDNKTVTGTPSGSFDGSTGYSADYMAAVCNNLTVNKAITDVNFLGKVAPCSTDSWFYNLSNLKTVNNSSNLDMSNVTTAESMFSGCNSLETLDVSAWDVSNCENFGRMFTGCSKLQALDVSKWNTSNIDYFIFMFEDCSSLTSLDVSGWDTAKSYHMNGVFKGCSNLTEIDVSGWDTSNVKYINNIFNGCSKLRYIDLSGFDISKAVNIADMFNDTNALEVFRLSSSIIDYFKSSTYDPSLPFPLHDTDGNTYNDANSLPDGGGTFFTNVPHSHDWDAGIVTDPTCTAQGYTTKTCKMCDEKETVDYKNALGHTMTSEAAHAPTCTEDGNVQYYHCDRCSKNFADINGNTLLNSVTDGATGHKWSNTWSNDESSHWRVCENSGCTEINGSGSHSWNSGTITTPPTCTTKGEKTFACTVCARTKTEEVDESSHTFGAWSSVDDNEHTHSCTGNNCTETETASHTYGGWVTDIQPTEDTEGSQHRDCSGCGHTQTQPIPTLQHVHSFAWVDEVAATCTTTGTVGHNHCSGCNLDFDASGAQLSDLVIPKSSHTSAVDGAVDPTCTETGLTEGAHCSVCGEVLTAQEEVPVLGHDYQWEITIEPTEEAEGLKEEKCTRCDDKGAEEVLAKLVVDDNGSVSDLPTGHDYDLEIAVKESESKYNITGVNKGYVVELFVVDGEDRTPYNADKSVILKLVIPEGMEEFVLYRMSGDRLTEVAADEYKVEGNMLSIRTKLPDEFVFNAPAKKEPDAGIPWWVWLIVVLGVLTVIGVVIVIIVVAKKKNGNGTTVVEGAQYDDTHIRAHLSEQDRKLDEIKEIVDGGFNDTMDE